MGQVSRMHAKGKDVCMEKMRELRMLADTVGDLFGSYLIPFTGSTSLSLPSPILMSHPYNPYGFDIPATCPL